MYEELYEELYEEYTVKETGIIKKNREEAEIEFQITDFFSVTEDTCDFFESTTFSFAGMLWYFEVHQRSEADPEYMTVCLRVDDPFQHPVEYEFGMKKVDGSLENIVRGVMADDDEWSSRCLIKVSDVVQRRSELAPSGDVTIKCILKLASNQPDLCDEPQQKKLKSAESLCQDYKKMFMEGQNPDIIVKVGDRNFSAHRNILMARSPVFQCMLSHDMLEKNSGVINVQDCDPQAMEQFLLYLYCGEVENLDESNMLGLYYAADKYEMWSLKDECCDFIKKSVSPTNICKVIPLAIDHDDSDLLEHVIEYFCENLQNILRTAEWQSFMKSNFETASELLVQPIEKLKDAER